MKYALHGEAARRSMVVALAASLLASTHIAAQPNKNPNTPAENRVTIEPYTGPAILLDEPQQIAAPRVVERKVLPEKYDGSEQVRVEREIVLYSDNHFEADGVYREYYPSGQLFIDGRFAKGRQDGEWTYYHPNGELNRKVVYADGQLNGAWEVHRADGSLAAKRSFAKGQRDGEWIIYDETGKLPIREEHYLLGKQDGVWKTWFPDGKLRQEISFKDGVKQGPSKEWNENGEIRAEINYVNNKPDGTAIVVFPDGRKVTQTYESGRLVSEKAQ